MASCSKEDDPAPVVIKTTYNKDIKPILVAKCTPCHLAGGANPNKWDDFTTSKIKLILSLIGSTVKLELQDLCLSTVQNYQQLNWR
ncbi:MAG: hypothetical protein IPO37_13585 [Saprospiraceae bacterium]|nr:hypothetical protein [Saprospiraceae bacterium]